MLSTWVTELGMAWKETCTMNERTILIGEYLCGDYSLAELARRRGVSRETAYKWIERYEEEGVEGLEERGVYAASLPN